ncbi:MAG TPA: hypothetical protein VKY57_12660, partial [Chitinispirillaceae bacterium]|nr:hypothetical protein [Chitinispirillaceae bacterium]
MEIKFWNKQIEVIDRDSLSKLQLERLRKTVEMALKTTFYRKRLAEVQIKSVDDIRTLDDIKRIPFTTKND